MKRLSITATACLALALNAGAMEKRLFHSADKSKSFSAVATGYNAKTDVVTVRKAAGQTLRFKLALLCKEDQAYVKENAAALAAASGIRVDFELFEGKRTTTRSDSERTVTTPAGYELTIENRTEQNFEDVDVEYFIFHRKDAEDGPGSITKSVGSVDLEYLFAKSRATKLTESVDLVRYSRRKSGGG